MSSEQSRNVDELLDEAQRVYQDSAAQVPPADETALAQRVAHFAAGVRFRLSAPAATQRLHDVTAGIGDVSSLSGLLPRILDGALALMGADFGNIQLVDPRSGALRIVTQSGFHSRFVDYFAVVQDEHSACGRAAGEGLQVVITDVETDPGFVPHRTIAAASGFRAVQSTPLVDHAGRLVGMLSTHFQRPYRPSSLDLRIMELYADFAGQAIAEHVSALNGHHSGDPIGRAMISALLDPRMGNNGISPADQPALLDHATSQFAHDVVTQLLSVGMSLATARGTAATGPAADRLTGDVDRMIRAIRTIMFSRMVDRANPPSDRLLVPPGGIGRLSTR